MTDARDHAGDANKMVEPKPRVGLSNQEVVVVGVGVLLYLLSACALWLRFVPLAILLAQIGTVLILGSVLAR